MPLIDLKTNLKSLKYGADQPGGGWSGQPFIQFPIEDKGTPVTILDFYKGNRTNPDFPIRGGGLKFDLGTQTFTLSSQIDKSRIKKFFESKPRGTAFLQKQIGLQLSNPKIETGNSFQVVPNSNIIGGLLENTRIYNNGINTLTQIGVQGTGTHLVRHGIFPIDLSSKYYRDIVGAQNINNNSSTNRLLILQKLKLSTNAATAVVNINQANKLGISLNRNMIFNYLGGPNSVYGIGSTTVRRYEDTSKASRVNTTFSMTYDAIMAQSLNKVAEGKKTTFIQDYRNPNASIQSREQVYSLTMKNSSDKMNVLKSFIFNNESDPWADGVNLSTDGRKDIIKFVFEAIENSNTTRSWATFFRAYLNGFSDSHQANISAFKYQGRGEDFYTYQGVSRTIGFSFKIAIESEKELRPLYTKLNHLISQVYPDYSENFGIMRAPIIRLTIGDYLYRVAGMLENVNVTIDDNAPWEITSNEELKQLPQVVNVQCSFKPIQDFLPRRINEYNTNVPFLTNYKEDYVSLEDHPTMIANKDRITKDLGGLPPSNLKSTKEVIQSLEDKQKAKLLQINGLPRVNVPSYLGG